MSLITLSTDFGVKDPDLGRLKGMILKRIPKAKIVDISHDITPFNTDEVVYILRNSLPYFPEGTIHLIGFNSETHLHNAPILIQAKGQYFIGSDDGILLKALENFDISGFKIKGADSSRFMQNQIEAAGQITDKKTIDSFALQTYHLHQIKLVQPKIVYSGDRIDKIVTKVIYVDNYRNAVFNLKRDEFESFRQQRNFSIKTGFVAIQSINQNYNDIIQSRDDMSKYAGKVFARFNDNDYLEIFVYRSNRQTGGASTLLGLRINAEITIQFE